LPANTVSFIDDTVSKKGYGTVYYQIRAYKGTYYTNYTQANSAVSFPAPTNIAYSKPDITTVTLTWTDNSYGEEGFYIDKKIEGENWGRYATLNADTETWSDTTAEINTNIYYSVYAYKGSNTTEHLNSPTINTTFPAPTNFNAVQNNVYTFTLNWTDNSIGEDGFKIERKIDDGTWSEIKTTTATTFIDSTVSKKGYGTVYYQVRAFKGTYFTSYATANSAVSFPAPTNINYFKPNITTVTLTWTDNSDGEEGFYIDKKIEGGNWGRYATLNADTETWSDTAAEINTNIYYSVYAFKGSNTTEHLNSPTINTEIPIPNNLTVTILNDNSLKLEWNYNTTGHDGFIIDRKTGNLEWSENFKSLDANAITYTDNVFILPGTTYLYRIRAYHSTQYSNYTDVIGNQIPDPSSFISVPAGTFNMGSSTGDSDEAPVHSVNITRPFYMGKYEVTQQESFSVSGSTINYYIGDLRPVDTASWWTAINYCNRRSIREGLKPCYIVNGITEPDDWEIGSTVTCDFYANGYRLPTEAEWEYVAGYNERVS